VAVALQQQQRDFRLRRRKRPGAQLLRDRLAQARERAPSLAARYWYWM